MHAERIVAIVGRPNVGKSALFNRFVGTQVAIVHDQAGVTRDRIVARSRLGKPAFDVVDTGGIGAVADVDFATAVRMEAEIAMESARVILFVVDGQSGLTPADEEIAKFLRKGRKPVILVVNKIDHDKHEANDAEFNRMGLSPMLSISAAHGIGIGDLVEEIEKLMPDDADPSDGEDEAAPPVPLKIAMVGRPNVGKSSLVNAIVGSSRTIVSDIAGTTRDAVDIRYQHDGLDCVLIDTAGIRARRRHDSSVEVFSVMRSEKSIRRADLCILVIDAAQGVTAQDQKIAGMIQEKQKACLIALNKWDLLKPGRDEHKAAVEKLMDDVRRKLFFLDYAPIVLVSALKQAELPRLFRAVVKIHKAARQRISTGKLNRLLEAAQSAAPPPVRGGRRLKLLYATQAEGGPTENAPLVPPKIIAFVNAAKALDDSYSRYLISKIREEQPFTGLPVILELRERQSSASR